MFTMFTTPVTLWLCTVFTQPVSYTLAEGDAGQFGLHDAHIVLNGITRSGPAYFSCIPGWEESPTPGPFLGGTDWMWQAPAVPVQLLCGYDSVNNATPAWVARDNFATEFARPGGEVCNTVWQLNRWHDIMAQHGFTEAAGNFQTTNYTGLGVGNDALLVEIYPVGAGAWNNAYFAGSPVDGEPARILMLPWGPHLHTIGQTPRHSVFSSHMLIHEATHGMTLRMIDGGPAWFDTQAYRAMHEGQSDALALIMTAAEATRNTVQAMAPWVGRGWNYGAPINLWSYRFGIRRFPACWDMSVNPLTYGDVDPASANWLGTAPASPLNIYDYFLHSQGECWAAPLWDCFVLLAERYGIDDARDRMLGFIVGGAALTEPIPNYHHMRDGLLAAEGDNDDRILLWHCFARRGLGINAASNDRTLLWGVIEDFTEPDWGDWNRDGIKDVADVAAFINDYTNERLRADIDLDHVVTANDLTEFLTRHGG